MKALIRLICIVFFCFMLSCDQSVKHSDAVKIGSPKEEELFADFFKRFNSDSVFQTSRVLFPFKVIQTGDEGEEDQNVFVNKHDWRKIELNYPEDKKYILTQTTVSDTEVNVLLQVEDTGIHVEHFFKKKDGLWFLAHVLDGSN